MTKIIVASVNLSGQLGLWMYYGTVIKQMPRESVHIIGIEKQ